MRIPTTIAVAVAVLWSAAASAQQETRAVTLELAPPESGDLFGCRMPVTVRYAGEPPLTSLRAVARAYDERDGVIASTGIETDDRPLIRDETAAGARYVTVPVQFDLTRNACEAMAGVGVVLARCRFGDGLPEDCLHRLRLEMPGDGAIEAFVGEPPGGGVEAPRTGD